MLRPTRARAVAVALAALGTGCWPGPQVGPVIGDPADTLSAKATFSEIQDSVLTPSCASALCHRGTPSPYTPLSLEDGQSWGNLVNRPASQAPSILLVNPGQPEASYLMLKMLGTVGSAGSVSTRMPPNAPILPSDQVEAVRAWIARGAPND